jgi:hypothetical protein
LQELVNVLLAIAENALVDPNGDKLAVQFPLSDRLGADLERLYDLFAGQ